LGPPAATDAVAGELAGGDSSGVTAAAADPGVAAAIVAAATAAEEAAAAAAGRKEGGSDDEGEAGATAAHAAPAVAQEQLRLIRVLMVHQSGSAPTGKLGWGWMCGKVVKVDDGKAERTAAREVEEETHGLLPATLLAPVLAHAPAVLWRAGSMALFVVKLRGAEALPRRFEAAVAGAGGRGSGR
jgi:hypothetical protein